MKTNSEIAYSKIKANILNCTYKPGEILSEKEIVETLNMSRTPVREALKFLDGEKYLKIISNVGIQISPISIKKMKEIYELRKSLEVLSIRKAIKHISASDIEYLGQLDKQLLEDLKTENLEGMLTAGINVHLFIAERAYNDTLYYILKKLREDSARGYVYLLRTHFEKSSIEERNKTKVDIISTHSDLVKALKNKDEELAIKLILEDLTLFMDLIFKY